MPDELDAQLLRRFAEARQPLADLPFVTQVAARLPTTFGPGVHLRALRGVQRLRSTQICCSSLVLLHTKGFRCIHAREE